MIALDPRYRWYKIRLKDENFKVSDFFFRGLTSRELRLAGTKEDTFTAETFILNSIVQPKKDWDEMLGGTATKLLKEIYRVSGLTEEQVPQVEAINWVQSETGGLEAAAIAMIPSCTPDVLESCDVNTYWKFLVMGKFQFETMYGIPVETAFVPGANEPPANVGVETVNPLVIPGPGEVGKQVESSFTWRRGQ